MSEALYVQNDSYLLINGLKDSQTGQFVNDANIVCNVTMSATGATVAGGVNVAIPYLSATNGHYRGVLPGSAALTAGKSYLLTFTASNYNLAFEQSRMAETRRC